MLRSRGQVTTAIRLDGVGKTYGKGRSAVEALRDVNVDFPEHSFTAVMGPSGSGKSTMIQCAAGLDQPSKGTVYLGDVKLSKLKEPKLTTTRRDQIGFIFQSFNLLPSLNAYQNIILPLKLAGRESRTGSGYRHDAGDYSDRCGDHRIGHYARAAGRLAHLAVCLEVGGGQ